MVIYVHRNQRAYQGRGMMCLLSWCGTFKETAWIIGDGGRLDGTGSENPGPPPCFHTAPDLYKTEFLSRCFTSTETIGLIRDGGIMKQEVRAQTHLPVFTQLMSSEG